jgi:RNase H-fold protein (predicted Holliday junction resolvase)
VKVLAVDPGREKCGLAVVQPGRVLHREVLPRNQLVARAAELVGRFGVEEVVVGDATGSQQVLRELSRLGRPVRLVSEAGTTLEARRRYFQDHPPRGLARLLPEGLRVPPRPYDDYVAVLLAERFLMAKSSPV